ncbi:MAG TPA: sigma-70 factor domain-containing protein, partial [Planctomycetota bacterium]
MAERFEQTIDLLTEEGTKKGFLTFGEISAILEDRFVPPERMDQIFLALEEGGIEIVDDSDAADPARLAEREGRIALPKPPPEPVTAVLEKSAVPERIDDPVRMYLTQMGEIPLLTRDQEIFLAKAIEITRKRFRKKAMGSGLCMTASLKTLEEVLRGELAFDRTLKVNPNPKPDDDPKIVETLGKQFLALRLPVNIETIRRLLGQIRAEYAPLLDPKTTRPKASEQLKKVQVLRRKLVILIEECHLQVKKVRPYIQML